VLPFMRIFKAGQRFVNKKINTKNLNH
jgi:hypothetical protein